MKEKYWFGVLMVTFKRMEILSVIICLYSEICHNYPGFREIWIFRKIYTATLKRYQKLMWKRDIAIPKCENLYWRWLEKPFLVKW